MAGIRRTGAASRFTPALCLLLLLAAGVATATEVTRKFNGLTLNANLEMADGAAFGDGMVILVHGYGAHNRMEIIHEAQRALRDNGRSSLAINLSLSIDNRRGYFGCETPKRHLQSDGVLELGAWVEWLRERDVGDIAVLGHSRGANQAMVYAVERLDPEVTHLVMLAPGLGDELDEIYLERYGVTIDEVRDLAERRVAAGKGGELMMDIDTLECPRRAITADSFLSYYSRPNKFRQFRDYLPRSPVPVLVITGSVDERQPNIAKLITPYADGKRIRVSVIEGAGHFFRDFNIDEAMEAAIEFIDET